MCYRVNLQETRTRIRVFCPDETRGHWGLKPLQTQKDVLNNQELAKEIRTVLRKERVREAYAPNIAPANAQMVNANDLSTRIDLGEGVTILRNQNAPGDGMFIQPRETLIMSGAGCPIIIATAGDKMVVAHAGRDSLIDRNKIMGERARENPSIVYTIVAAFIRQGFPPNEIKMRMLFSIPKEVFGHRLDDPIYRKQNCALAAFIRIWCEKGAILDRGTLFLDLEEIFLKQAEMLGVLNPTVSHSLKQFPAMAHTRDGEKNPRDLNGIEVPRRNLLVIERL